MHQADASAPSLNQETLTVTRAKKNCEKRDR